MEPEVKAQIMYEHLLTDDTYNYLQDSLIGRPQQPLGLYRELINCFTDDDFEGIRDNNIFLNVIFSPASNSNIKVSLPVGAKVITFDFNSLSPLSKDERMAVLLHEYGHAFNTQLRGEEGEFAADDFAINHCYGEALRQSLQRSIEAHPDLYDKPITHNRIKRIPQ